MTNTRNLLPMKKLLTLISIALMSVSSYSNAETIAITHATIYSAPEQGMLNDATVIIEDGKITAVHPNTTAENSVADTVVDAKGKILTPGLIGSMNQLGLVEVSAVADTRDAKEKKADITFDTSLAYNPQSTLIPYTRKGGVTRNIVTPFGGDDLFKGTAFVVDLSGGFNSVMDNNIAVVVELGAKSSGSRAYELQSLFKKFEGVSDKITASENSKKDKEKADKLSADEQLIQSVLAGEKPLIAYADRASDMLALIKFKSRLGFELIIVGAADAQLITEQLVNNDVVVIIDAMRNLPGSFDSLHVSLDTVGQLTASGVKVIISVDDSHNLSQLRYSVGNAIANGTSREAALASVTSNISDAFKLNTGKIAVGYDADIVLWSADPFEISSKVEQMWILGIEVSTYSRQDALRDRYMTPSDMPRAYTK